MARFDSERIREEPMIEVQGVSKEFGQKLAVTDLDFQVIQGEIFSLLGPNGAGKSTIMRMMIGLLTPTQGEIRIGGLNVQKASKQVHQQIGVVFELPNLYNRLSVHDNLQLFADIYGVSKARVNQVLEALYLDEKKNAKVGNLSKGWKQRVLIARSILHEPKVLFLDEPTSGLDPNTTKGIRDYLLHLKSIGTTLVITTHDMHEAEELSDHVAIMYNGRIVALDSPSRLKAQYGSKQLRIQLKMQGGGESIIELPFESDSSSDYLYQHLRAGDVLSIHSTEASLAQVFAQLTGSELS